MSKHEAGADNPVKNPVDTQPGKNGGTLKRGGSNPGAGRPPNEFKERMRALVSREDVEAYFERCLTGEFGPKFHIAAIREARDRGYGKAVQPIVGEGDAPLKMIVEYVDPPNADG